MFIAADINKRVLKKKQSKLQLQQILLSATKDNVTSKMNGAKANIEKQNKYIQTWNNLDGKAQQTAAQGGANSDLFKQMNAILQASSKSQWYSSQFTGANKFTLSEVEYKSDQTYLQYQIEDQRLDAEQDSLESQLKLLSSEIESQEKLVQNNISSDMKMWCYGG